MQLDLQIQKINWNKYKGQAKKVLQLNSAKEMVLLTKDSASKVNKDIDYYRCIYVDFYVTNLRQGGLCFEENCYVFDNIDTGTFFNRL